MNIPVIEFKNLFSEDPTGEKFWSYWIGKDIFRRAKNYFKSMGEAGALAAPFSARADKLSPTLMTHGPDGERIDRVTHHPDYHSLEELSYGRGIIKVKYVSEYLDKFKAVRHITGFGAGYYFAQTEMSLYCPICMTDGVGRILERHADPKLAKKVIAHLASTDQHELWQGSMYLTERQGGSDVGTNEVTATKKGDRWFLNGDKWFCSNVAADCILALARMPGGASGTKGLGLFLVVRKMPEDNSKTIRIHRIKDKLGVRSMATGEITFENTEGFLIGGVGEGFKQMAEMLNLSRLYNSVASMAATRRAVLEAVAYGSQRKAFGTELTELPLWRSAMADVVAEFWAMFSLVFETVRSLDGSDMGDDDARKLTRMAIPMAKAMSGKFAIFAVSECMEQVGGNGYVEENILPRLLRDCQVLPIWEGTTHILTLDLLRAIQKEKSDVAFFARIEKALKTAAKFKEQVEHVRERVERDQLALKALLKSNADDQQRDARQWLESAARTFALALLLEQAVHNPLKDVCLASFKRIVPRPFFTAPVNSGQPSQVTDTERVLLASVR